MRNLFRRRNLSVLSDLRLLVNLLVGRFMILIIRLWRLRVWWTRLVTDRFLLYWSVSLR